MLKGLQALNEEELYAEEVRDELFVGNRRVVGWILQAFQQEFVNLKTTKPRFLFKITSLKVKNSSKTMWAVWRFPLSSRGIVL